MEWISFTTGMLTVAFAYGLFSQGTEEDELETEEEGYSINESGRHVTLSCQTCRKLKRHKEIGVNLYQCVKCKRYVDLR